MKYLAIATVCNEPDNNTPASEVFIKSIECNEADKDRWEEHLARRFVVDGHVDCDVELLPLSSIKDEWQKVSEQY